MNWKLLRNLDALLITNPTNVRYLTGFVGAAPEEREAYVLVTNNQTFLFTNALYREEAASLKRLNLLGTKGLTFIEISRDNPFSKKLSEVVTKAMRVGFEENDLTVGEYNKLKNVRLTPTKDRVETLRMIKREDEIETIRQAANLTDQCFDFTLRTLKPGITENAIAWEIESFIRTRGAQLAFSPIVAFGKNTSQPHCRTSDVRLKTSDIILMDFGARVNGYCSDMTRVVFVGKPDDEWVKAYETVKNAQAAALDTIHNNPDQIARTIIRDAGFPVYPHSLGHGVGLDIHEAPRLTIKKDVTLKPGMVVTVEPALYKEGSYGIRIEDLILLNKDGIEVLSRSTKEVVIL